ncbi:hypothetical protein RB200_03865 [Streptomyces sp. PmtG]
MHGKAGAALLAAAVLTTALTACGNGDGEPRPAVTVTETVTADGARQAPPPSPKSTAEPSGAPGADARGDGTWKLTETAVYDHGVEVSLSRFARGVSSAYAAPENTPYVAFTLKLKNGTGKVVDVGELSILCQYGTAARDGEEIFDSERGLDGPPRTHLRPGRAITARMACELPKSQTYVQIEVTPDYATEAAVFGGNVK